MFPPIEANGLTRDAVDGLVALVTPLSVGAVVGRLRDQSRARADRLSALFEIQRSLAAEGPLEERLASVAGRVRELLGAESVGLLVSGGAGEPVGVSVPSGMPPEPASAAAWTLCTGEPVTTRDVATDGRFALRRRPEPAPLRGLVLPLGSSGGPVGALALQWRGDLSGPTRQAAEETAMHLALGIENARLTLCQRDFARELEGKVAVATARLRELDHAKSEFLSVVSHELRTPLTALQGFSELLLSRDVPPERAARFLGHLHREAQRLGRIVGELLDLSRIEAGQGETLRREEVDLGRLVEDNIELLAPEHPRHRFEWEPAPGLPTIIGDRDAVDRIVKNLLSNAVKYSPRGGRVRLSAGAAADRPGMIELVVEDEGVGIPAEALASIWDKYVRVANAETATARGLGLGLALVRRLVEAHGGTAEVRSEPGRGTCFRLCLPG